MDIKSLKTLLKKIILKYKFLYEIYFFITRKKINRNKLDKKISLYNRFRAENKKINSLIVSLTTYGERLKDVKYTLYSILCQCVLPEKVVLWVSYEDYDGNLTYIKNLLKIFESSCLEIKKTKDIFSYKKLIPALNSFPDYYILTADDDIYYRKDWVKKIWDEHEKNPDNIICYVAHKILLKGNNVLPYKQWESNIRDEKAGFFIFGCGCGGGLYHKKYLYKDVVNEKLFLKLAPTADDIWFYFMVIMNNRKYKVVKGPHNRLKYTDIYKEYGLNDKQILASQNVDQGKNDIQFSTIMEYYDLDFCKLISTGHF